MSYRARILASTSVAVAFHVLLLPLLPLLFRGANALPTVEAAEDPIVLSFRQPDDRRHRQLIDSGAPAEGPVKDTDLISDRDSQAQDLSEVESETKRPDVETRSDFDDLGTPPVPPAVPDPVVQETVAAESADTVVERTGEVPAAEDTPAPSGEHSTARVAKLPAPTPEPEPSIHTESAESMEIEEEAEPEEPEQTPEPIEMAQARPQPVVQVKELRSTRGREGGGAMKSGFTSFEANKHELGAYMLKIREKVERQWRAGLVVRYESVSRTKAIIECSIAPDGRLAYARILDTGDSLSFAIICRNAIEKAAPFGPFPFDVPEIYRQEDLEIIWRFSYL